MKAIFEQITSGAENSFLLLALDQPSFDAPYHYHPELELTMIQHSHGKRYVGGKVSEYASGDLVLVGGNLPHCWLSEHQGGDENDRAIVIQFQKNFAGESLWGLPEFAAIRYLLEQADSGLAITGSTRQQIIPKMEQLVVLKGFERFALFIEILNIIAVSAEKEAIDLQFSGIHFSPAETDRFQRIFNFLITNYRQEISLQAVAEIAHLTPTAFCRYFKHITRKTLIEFITECRINDACIMLRHTDKPVLEICTESGFGNISYFNKTFKTFNGNAPLQYRKLFLKQQVMPVTIIQ